MHEPSCTCEICVAWRSALVQNRHPLMNKTIKPTRVIVPVEQAIAQIAEAIECYQARIDSLQAEMRILRDE
jgi:rubrerythrin